MKTARLGNIFLCFLLLCAFSCTKPEGGTEKLDDIFTVADKPGMTVKGVIYDDEKKPVEGVPVTDGFLWTKTDINGQYWLATDFDKCKFIIASTPGKYVISNNKGLPGNLFNRIELMPGQKVFRSDFRYEKIANPDRYTLFISADTQFRSLGAGYDNYYPNRYHSVLMYRDMISDMRELAQTITDRPVYGICLGDLVHNADDNTVIWDQFVNENGLAKLGFPTFCVIGNHDFIQQYEGEGDIAVESRYMYERYIGPANFSFNIGKIHFLAVSDIIMKKGEYGEHTSGLIQQDLNYLLNDLKNVPKNTKIFLIHHSQMFRLNSSEGSEKKLNGQQYADALKDYKRVYSWAGDAHIGFNYVYEKYPNGKFPNIEAKTLARSTGALWLNSRKNSEGTPRGYYVVDVDGEDISWYYKCTDIESQCVDHKDHAAPYNPSTTVKRLGYSLADKSAMQMTVYKPGTYAVADGMVYANIYLWDELWGTPTVTDNLGKMSVMTRVSAIDYDYDQERQAAYNDTHNTEAKREEFKTTSLSSHIFRGQVSAGATKATVSVTDRFGNTYTQTISCK